MMAAFISGSLGTLDYGVELFLALFQRAQDFADTLISWPNISDSEAG